MQEASSDSTTARHRSKQAIGVLAISSSRVTPGAATADLQQLQLIAHAPLVVASCGSIHTPVLLLPSGVKAGGNVGQHLRLHPAAGFLGFFEPSAEQRAAGKGAVDMYEVSSATCGCAAQQPVLAKRAPCSVLSIAEDACYRVVPATSAHLPDSCMLRTATLWQCHSHTSSASVHPTSCSSTLLPSVDSLMSCCRVLPWAATRELLPTGQKAATVPWYQCQYFTQA
jgi:hypothetical protein